MIRFNVGGRYLELPENLSLTFKKTNVLFAFDKIECERSTSFDIPATPENDRIFGLAKWVQTVGTGMRRRYEAQMQAGMITKDGYLYVSTYAKGNYKAVFVIGELLGLMAIKEAGSVRDILQYDSKINWNDSAVVPANLTSIANVALVDYVRRTAHVNPSVSLRWLIEEAAQAVGAAVDFTNANATARVRLFQNAESYGLDGVKVHLRNDPTASQDPVNISSFLGLVQYVSVLAARWRATSYAEGGGPDWDLDGATLISQDQFDQISLPYDCVLEFPENTPQNLCIVSGNIFCRYVSGQLRCTDQITFFGTRQFNGFVDTSGSVQYMGDPLAGQSVHIPANTPFMLTDGAGLVYPVPASAGQTGTIGFYAAQVPAYDVLATISVDHEWEYGEAVPWNALLPDLTLVELLKMCAYMSGAQLTYDGTIRFDRLDVDTFGTKPLTDVIETTDLKRTFGDYVSENVVQYDSAENVLSGEKIKAIYVIDNDNLEETKELAKLKASEGKREFNGALERLLIVSYDGKLTAGNASTADTKMLRVGLPKNAGLQRLCDESTSVQMRVRMTLEEFEQITPKTAIYYNGVRYVWNELQFGKDTATLKLSKI